MLLRPLLTMLPRVREFSENSASRLVATTALTGVIVQVGRPIAALVTMPFLLGELGQAGLGVWMIALSLMALVGTLNSGLSITLVTAFGRASSQNSADDNSRLATAGIIIALATALLTLALCLPAIWLFDGIGLLSLDGGISAAEVCAMLSVMAGTLAFGFLAAVPRQIMMGQLHGYVAHMLDLAGVIVGSGALIFALIAGQPLWVLALAFMAPSPVLLVIGGMLYLRRYRIAMFTLSHIHGPTVRELGRDSLRMVGYHTAYSISSQSDLLLIGALVGAPASAVYGVAQRVFSLPILLAQAFNQAQWPAMARADAAGDWSGFDRTLRLTLVLLTTSCAVLSCGIALVYPDLVTIWLGRPLQTEAALLIGMVVWVPLAVVVNIFDAALRAQSATGYLARSMFVMAAINLVSSLILIRIIGYPGALWGTIVGYTLALLIPYALRYTAESSGRMLKEGARR